MRGIKIRNGPGPSPMYSGCVMQIVAHVSGEGWTDRPDCADPLLTSLARSAMDEMLANRRGTIRVAVLLRRMTRLSAGQKRQRSMRPICALPGYAYLRPDTTSGGGA